MKIGLITIVHVPNYGAVLQAYASHKFLSRYGTVQIINYKNKFLDGKLKLFRFENSIHGIKMFIHDVTRYKYNKEIIRKFKHFITNNLSLTRDITYEDLINDSFPNYDVYICGSDQIWNPEIVTHDRRIDPAYFLAFAPEKAKKISFASSIGNYNFSEQEKKYLRKLLDDFSFISVREKDGVEKISRIIPEKKIFHLQDPTLLLTKNEWLESFNIVENKYVEKYILVYSVQRTELVKNTVKYFSDKLKLKIIIIDKMFIPLVKADIHIRDAGPVDFVELIANASFIITDSFHGTCFAINFNIPFVAVAPGSKVNRIKSLMSVLGVKNRIVEGEKDLSNVPLSEVNATDKLKNNIENTEQMLSFLCE